MKKLTFLIGLLLCPFVKISAQIPIEVLDALKAAIAEHESATADTTKKLPDSLHVQSLQDSLRRDSLRTQQQMHTLKTIAVRAPRPIYSMDDEVVNYNVSNDETVRGLTALDALQNAPSVEVDIDGNISMRGSSNIEIWLNGYPTHMNGPTLKVYLESLPADAIARIEVIKNPSAKYMVAEGYHIINIVTSAKLRNSHFLSFGTGLSNRPSISPWASYVLQNERFTTNIYLGTGYTPKHSNKQSSQVMRQLSYTGFDTTAISHSSNQNDIDRLNTNLFLSLNYKLDSMNDLSLFAMAMAFPSQSSTLTVTDQQYFWPQGFHYRLNDSEQAKDFNLIGMANMQWKHKFDNEGHNFTLGLYDNLNVSRNDRTVERNYDLLAGSLPSTLFDFGKRYVGGMTSNSLSLSASYNRPLFKNDELTAGLTLTPTYNRNYSDPSYFDSATSLYTISDTLRRFDKHENGSQISANVSLRHKWKSVTLTLGLRGYWTTSHYQLDALFDDDTTLSRFYLRPSLGLTYRTASMHYFRFNYSLATTLPSAENLSSVRRYSEDSYKVGNPGLHSEHTHNFDLSWNRYFSKVGSVGIESYARLSSGNISYCDEAGTEVDPFLGRVVSFRMPYNVGSSFRLGIEGNVTYRPVAWLNFRLYANLYRSGYEVDHPKAGHYSSTMTSYSFRINCWANIARRVRINLSGNYASPTQSLFAQSQGSHSIDLGVSTDFLQKRLSVALNVSDLFNWNRSQSWSTNPLLLAYSTSHTDSRFVSLSVTLRFGKMELQSHAREGESN